MPSADTKSPPPVIKPSTPPQRDSDTVQEKIEDAQTEEKETAPKDAPDVDNRVIEGEEQNARDVKEADEGELHKEKRIIEAETVPDAGDASKDPPGETVQAEKEAWANNLTVNRP